LSGHVAPAALNEPPANPEIRACHRMSFSALLCLFQAANETKSRKPQGYSAMADYINFFRRGRTSAGRGRMELHKATG